MRKLDIGNSLSAVFDLYGKQFGVLVPAALIVFLPVAIVVTILGGVLAPAVDLNNPVAMQASLEGAQTKLWLLYALTAIVAIVAGYTYQGILSEAAQDMQDGKRDLSVGQLISGAMPHLGRLIITAFLIWLATGLPVAIADYLSQQMPALFIVYIIVAVIAIWLYVRWSLAAPAVVIETKAPTAAMARSAELVEGNWWRVVAVFIVMGIVTGIAYAVLSLILIPLFGFVLGLGLVILVVGALAGPLLGLVPPVLFLALRGDGAPGDVPPPAAPPVDAPPAAAPPPPPAADPPPPAGPAA